MVCQCYGGDLEARLAVEDLDGNPSRPSHWPTGHLIDYSSANSHDLKAFGEIDADPAFVRELARIKSGASRGPRLLQISKKSIPEYKSDWRKATRVM
jgi:hypothetical protein